MASSPAWRELVDIALRHADGNGVLPTTIRDLSIARGNTPAEPVHSVHRASLCFIVQGAKQMTVGRKIYRYTPSQFLVSTVDLPITGEIIEATERKPYLCYVVAIAPEVVYEILQHAPEGLGAGAGPGIFVGQEDAALDDAMLRLARCLDVPADRTILAPGILREIVYRLLQGPFGRTVRDLGVVGSQTQRIAKAIERIKNDYAQTLQIDLLAKLSGMSPSSFHEHFKKVTTLSPLQYQKQLRLHEARRLLLLVDGAGAADVGFRVGYQSPTQFSREYARFFGRAPVADVRALRATS